MLLLGELVSPFRGHLFGQNFVSSGCVDACFRMRITLGVLLIRSVVYVVCVPGRLWSGSGVGLN